MRSEFCHDLDDDDKKVEGVYRELQEFLLEHADMYVLYLDQNPFFAAFWFRTKPL